MTTALASHWETWITTEGQRLQGMAAQLKTEETALKKQLRAKPPEVKAVNPASLKTAKAVREYTQLLQSLADFQTNQEAAQARIAVVTQYSEAIGQVNTAFDTLAQNFLLAEAHLAPVLARCPAPALATEAEDGGLAVTAPEVAPAPVAAAPVAVPSTGGQRIRVSYQAGTPLRSLNEVGEAGDCLVAQYDLTRLRVLSGKTSQPLAAVFVQLSSAQEARAQMILVAKPAEKSPNAFVARVGLPVELTAHPLKLTARVVDFQANEQGIIETFTLEGEVTTLSGEAEQSWLDE